MRDLASCSGENGVQVAGCSLSKTCKTAQNLVICVYQCQLPSRPCLITVTWSKHLMGQGLAVGIDDCLVECLCKSDIKPWLFSKRRGSKSMEAYSCKIDIHWDLSSAKFGARPEPLKGFYVGVVVDRRMILLLGDLRKEAFKKTNSRPVSSDTVFLAKREHILGKDIFCTRAQFHGNGQSHDLVIECDADANDNPRLMIRVDSKTIMRVKQLQWKFRGHHTISVDGLAVEVCWDVHNWLFSTRLGNAVFMFKTFPPAKKLSGGQSLRHPNEQPQSFSQRFPDSKSQNPGFSLILYAWKNE